MSTATRIIGTLGLATKLSQELQKNVSGFTVKQICYNSDLLKDKTAFNVTADQLSCCEIIVADPNLLDPFLDKLENVKWVQSIWAGVETVVNAVKQKKKPSFTLTRFGGLFGRHLSEYVISNIINMERGAFHHYDAQKECQWRSNVNVANGTNPYRLLSSLSICILGVGDIGKEIARSCKFFNMTVYGMVSSTNNDSNQFVDEYFTTNELPSFLQKSDYVCNVLPKTPQTNDILSNSVLKNCQERQAVLINVGRGNVVRNECIIEACKNNWIKGAVLDVFENEPLPQDSLLWNLPNVIITPHCAGLTLSHEIMGVFLENLELYKNKEKLRYVVDWEKGY